MVAKLTGVEKTEYGYRATPRAAEISRFSLDVPKSLPAELFTTDRVLKRWAVSVGTGLPEDKWDDTRKARLSPLDDATAIVVDQIVCSSPEQTKKLLVLWYKTPHPVSEIARRLKMRHESTYRGHAVVLHYQKWRFLGSRHADLIAMVNKDVDFLGNAE